MLLDEPPTIVSGLGRCGSSLICQMLYMGGMHATGDATWPMFEDSRSQKLPYEVDWLRQSRPYSFVKILNPNHFPPPEGLGAKVIWLHRKTEEQVKSWVKWGNATQELGEQQRMLTKREIWRLVRQRRKDGLAVMKKCGDVLELWFELVLAHPDEAARLICDHIDIELNEAAMVTAAFPRKGACLKGFLESANTAPGALKMVDPGRVK